jgi:hypothetical protein
VTTVSYASLAVILLQVGKPVAAKLLSIPVIKPLRTYRMGRCSLLSRISDLVIGLLQFEIKRINRY